MKAFIKKQVKKHAPDIAYKQGMKKLQGMMDAKKEYFKGTLPILAALTAFIYLQNNFNEHNRPE
ncbi:MAG: hypothetical protein J5757_09390 [Lachnospiraceae bacterium]|nr:hypothetical protein [Lachnospiraceae bacterium]